MAEVALRPIDDSDLDALFTAENPDDRTAFDVPMAKVRTSPEATNRAVTVDGRLVGSIASFEETILRLDEAAKAALSDVSSGERQTY